MAQWLDATGTKIVIGKGGMPRDDYTSILAPRGAVYLTTVGYGTGALLGRGVEGVHDVHWLDELGIAQAMWMFRVKGSGRSSLTATLRAIRSLPRMVTRSMLVSAPFMTG